MKTGEGVVRVPSDPERVVVLSAGLTGYVLALGAPVEATDARLLGVPVDETGFPSVWAEQARRQGAEALPAGDLDIEAVAAARPDLIIGGGQGFTAMQAKQAYRALTRIAPTVLVSERLATWQEQLAFIAQVLDARARAAERRVATTKAAIALPPQPTAVLLTTAEEKPFLVPPAAELAEDPVYEGLPAFRADQVHQLPAQSYRPDYYSVLETLDLLRREFRR